MRYLPYANEYTWGEIVPHDYIYDINDPLANELPLTYNAGMRVWQDLANRNYPGAAIGFATYPVSMIGDMLGKSINQSINGYTRLYNNAAALYNNAAANAENRLVTRNTPQTRLTGRKITYDMNPALYNMTVEPVQKTVYAPVPATTIQQKMEPIYGIQKNLPAYGQQTTQDRATQHDYYLKRVDTLPAHGQQTTQTGEPAATQHDYYLQAY